MLEKLRTTRRLTLGLLSLVATATAGSVAAEEFSLSAESHGLSLKIEQAYDSAGVSKPTVAINGAVLRQYAFVQRLSIVLDHTFDNGDRAVVLHHWQGGNACGGALTLFSLTEEGFLETDPVAQCAENFSASVSAEEPGAVEIATYSDEAKTSQLESWLFISDQMVKR